MRIWMILVIPAFLSACAEMSKMKVAEDGNYYFKDKPVSVWAPDKCLLDMFVYEADRSVDFVTGRGYWMASGQYALQVFPIPTEVVDKKCFIEESRKYFDVYMVKDRKSLGLDFSIREKSELRVKGVQAYRVIATDPGKAVFIATGQLHKNHITVASLVYPLKEGEPYKEAIPMKCYNNFVESVAVKE